MARACALKYYLCVLTVHGYLGTYAKESVTFSGKGRESFGNEGNYLNWVMVVPENTGNHK